MYRNTAAPLFLPAWSAMPLVPLTSKRPERVHRSDPRSAERGSPRLGGCGELRLRCHNHSRGAAHATDANYQLIQEPGAGYSPIVGLISVAVRSVRITIYELNDPAAVNAPIDDQNRGVDIRVILDAAFHGLCSPTTPHLSSAVKTSPPQVFSKIGTVPCTGHRYRAGPDGRREIHVRRRLRRRIRAIATAGSPNKRRYPGGRGRFRVQTMPHSKRRSPTWSYSLKWWTT